MCKIFSNESSETSDCYEDYGNKFQLPTMSSKSDTITS